MPDHPEGERSPGPASEPSSDGKWLESEERFWAPLEDKSRGWTGSNLLWIVLGIVLFVFLRLMPFSGMQ